MNNQQIFSSSYSLPGMQNLITSFVESLQPKVSVEIGTQQGMSSILIGNVVSKYNGKVYTYDLFEDTYTNPPYSNTHANIDVARQNIAKVGLSDTIQVNKGNHNTAFNDQIDIHGVGFSTIDLLHVDICNHLENLKPILPMFIPYIKKGIILEGGIWNEWQKKHGYYSYQYLLDDIFDRRHWQWLTVPFNNHNAVTLCRRIV